MKEQDKNKLLELNLKMNDIFNANDLTWQDKFNLIFSDNISAEIFKLTNFSYYQPDETYEIDVTAFVNAFNNYVKTYLKYE